MSGGCQKRDEYGLTPQQRKFADLHRLYRDREDKFTIDAYLEAYPTNNRVTAGSNAPRVLRLPKVAAYIAMLDNKMSEKLREEHDISVSRLVEELAHGALYNIQELLDNDGKVRDLKELPEQLARAIVSVKVTTTKLGKVSYDIKMMDKAACIDRLIKYLGGYPLEGHHIVGEIRHTLEPLPEVQEILDAVYNAH